MPRLATLEVFRVDYPVKAGFRFLPSGAGAVRHTVVVKLTDDDGHVGWGQSVPSPRWSCETLESVATAIAGYFAPALSGTALDEWPPIQEALDRVVGPGFSRGQPIAKAAIDLAWTDWNLRREKLTLAQWLGRPSSQSVQLSWTVDATTPSEAAAQVEEGRQQGYRSFNMKLTADPRIDLQLSRHVRALIGDAFLWVDANGTYQLDDALTLAPQLADLGVAAWEQPFPSNRISWYQRLRQQHAVRVLMDEPIITEVDVEEFYHLSMLDGIVIKIARCGGILGALRVLEKASDLGLYVLASGLTDPDISFAASLLLLGAFQYSLPAALNAPQFLTGTILQTELTRVGDLARVPVGLGLGVEVDEERVRSGMAK